MEETAFDDMVKVMTNKLSTRKVRPMKTVKMGILLPNHKHLCCRGSAS